MNKILYTISDPVYISIGYASDDIDLAYTAVGYARPISQHYLVSNITTLSSL